MLADFLLELVARPLSHGNNLDELVCLAVPMLLLGIVFMYVMRNSESDEDEADDLELSKEPQNSQGVNQDQSS